MTPRFKQKLSRAEDRSKNLAANLEIASERYFFRRFGRLRNVRRFVIGWLVLLLLFCAGLVGQIRALNGQFQSLQPVAGGAYSEGILGDFTNANPLYATSQVDESVSKLLFAGLFKYNDQNQLVGDLASGYTINDTAKSYTVSLKPGLTWHDGRPLTARDVAFTYKTIQNPESQSVLASSWQGITVTAVNDQTIRFDLPSILASFPYTMTNGIIPQHILGEVAPAEMRGAAFNTAQPVGSGPFSWQKIEVSGDSPETRQAQIGLMPFDKYNGGAPKLNSFVVHTFHDERQLIKSFDDQGVTAASFSVPPVDSELAKGVQTRSFVLSAADMVFFKQSSPALKEAPVRKALVQAVNVPAISGSLGYVTKEVNGPLLLGQLGYDKTLTQPGFDPAAAAKALDSAGWVAGADGTRSRGGLALRFSLFAQDTPESRLVTSQLVSAWKSVGARAEIQLQSGDDLQRTIGNCKIADGCPYDALLYGISIGVDPDVFVYWHTSQNDVRSSGLNFSKYSNKSADSALEAGRTRIEPDLRAVKYKPFLQAWQADAPALGLYQPRYLYLTHGTVYGLNDHILNTPTDRFNSVSNWQIRQVETTAR